MKTAVMLVGFGGPTSMDGVKPFLESVLQGIKIPQARFDEVLHHYEIFDGVSPYNEITQRQSKALALALSQTGNTLPVFVGLRHSRPSFEETFLELKEKGVTRVIAFVLASFRSYSSFEKYQEAISRAQSQTQTQSIQVIYTGPFYENPLFIQAQAQKVKEQIKLLKIKKEETYFLFSAHSIPVPMSEQSGYAQQFLKTSTLIANQLGVENWSIAYQSRSGNPRDPWLEPDTKDTIKTLDKNKFKNVFLVVPGFLCDNVEVLYDLDIETKDFCQSLGLNYFRAQTVSDHALFVQMICDLVMVEYKNSST